MYYDTICMTEGPQDVDDFMYICEKSHMSFYGLRTTVAAFTTFPTPYLSALPCIIISGSAFV